MTNITKFPNRRSQVSIERLAELMNELRNDPEQATWIAYCELLHALTEAYEAAERYATEHHMTPSPSDYLKENTTHA